MGQTKVFDYVLTFGWNIVVFRSSFVCVAIHPRDLLSINAWILKNSVDGFAEYQRNSKPQMQSLLTFPMITQGRNFTV